MGSALLNPCKICVKQKPRFRISKPGLKLSFQRERTACDLKRENHFNTY